MCTTQARSQKFAIGGCVGGGMEHPAAGGTGVWGRSPQRSKNLHFFAKITSFLGYFYYKIMLLKRSLEIGSANKIKLVA